MMRWRAAGVAALAAGTLGFLFGNPLFLIIATVPTVYAVYGYLSGIPSPELAVERSVEPEAPEPGEAVTVRLTVENVGESPLPDLRVADDPPPVPVDGSTEAASALRVGESLTVEYDLSLPRGTHEFGDPRITARGVAGRRGEEADHDVDGATEITCRTLLDDVPLRDRTIHYVGRTPTDTGGSGVEFFSTREYQRGDPVNRIDWRRFARTGELTTVDMRVERAITVVFVIDDRAGVQRSWPGYGPDTLDLTTYAVSRALPSLLESNHRVGVAACSGLAADDLASYTDPGRDAATRSAASETVEYAQADGGGVSAERAIRALRERLPANAQVVLCTPLTDGFAEDLVEELEAGSHGVTILSPDLTTAGGDPSLGAATEALQRRARADRLQRRGVPVVDWSLEDPLALTLSKVFETWGETR